MDAGQVASTQLLIIASVGLGMLLTFLLFGVYLAVCEYWQQREHQHAEDELDRQSKEVRQTILSLAESLATDKDEAATAMARASFLATGRME
jgi:hypothetical protein